MTITKINTDTIEGRLLMAALTIITTESRRHQEPDTVLSDVVDIGAKMYKDHEPVKGQAFLGYATTGELLEELSARAEVGGYSKDKTVEE